MMTEQHPTTAVPMTETGAVKIELCDYDPAWPAQFLEQAARIRGGLGVAAMEVDHVGSTSVPGLAAKPIIDIVLTVADTTNEAAYAPTLETAGYSLTVRELEWFEHRMFKGSNLAVNLHVFSQGCPEIDRVKLFRDWLKTDPDDLALYAGAKRRLAQDEWGQVQDDADAKTEVIAQIMDRARRWAEDRAGPLDATHPLPDPAPAV